MFENKLLEEVRDRFCHVDSCPFQGPRAFFENAGGSLTLKSVVEVNTAFAQGTARCHAISWRQRRPGYSR